VDRGSPPDFATGVLLHHTAVGDVEQIVERLKFSRAEMQHTVSLVENLPKFATVEQMSTSALKRFFRLLRFADHLELARIHAIATDDDLRQYQYASGKYQGWSREEIAPAPLISGEDLIELGYEPGPLFKRILSQIEDEQLEGSIVSREQALDFVRSHYSVDGPS
jgi:poly(A) polymerase